MYNTVTLPLCSAMNLQLVQLAQECMNLTVEEMKILIQHLKTLIDSEELSSVSKSSWRKRQVLEQMERENND
jgi:hypothetical protein